MSRYAVYELDGDGRPNYIGSVEADDEETARDTAHEQYGAPIEVEER